MKQMKKLLCCLMVICMVFSMLPVTAQAATSGTCGENLTWVLDENGTLTISGTGAMEDYSEWYANSDWTSVETIVIEQGVTSIGNYAFYGCASLTDVTIPDSVTSIGTEAFSYCSSLTGVTIPDSVTNIGDWTFSWCTSLTSVTIPDSVTSIGAYAFYGCEGLADEEGFVIVNDILFYYCGSGGDIVIPNSVTSIGYNAFFCCDSLTGVTIPDSVTSIGNYAFHGCASLTDITIPDGITNIGAGAFSGCEGLADEDGFVIVNGILFDYLGSGGNIVIPNSVTTIGDDAFEICSSLTGVTIPDSITSIGDYAFYSCESLTSVTIPNSVTSIGWSAFLGCTSLTKIVFEGDAPEMFKSLVGSVTATAYYPAGNATWTADVMQDYDDTIIWVPYEPGEPAVEFSDVKEGQWFYGTVQWAVAEDITKGMTATTFGPGETCTRKQVVTFLWRAQGSPEPTSTKNPFVDVKESDYFYKAVLWAVENQITSGVDATHFAPNNPCTRGQVVTFLHRAAGKPAPKSTNNPFTDVGQDYYTEAVLWAVGEEITAGMTATTFAPGNTCTRAQIVTFLYRFKN